jgi:TonB family protein
MPEKYKGSTDENPKLAEYRTFVRFVVNEDGSISDIQLLKKSAEFKDLDEEAIRVVKSMPNWEPGKIGGKPVKVYFNLPIIFKFKK